MRVTCREQETLGNLRGEALDNARQPEVGFLYPQAVVLTNFRVKRHFKIECNKRYKTGWG